MPTPLRSMRLDDDLWLAAQLAALRNNTSVTDVIKEHLMTYTAANRPTMTLAEAKRIVLADVRRSYSEAEMSDAEALEYVRVDTDPHYMDPDSQPTFDAYTVVMTTAVE